MCGSFSLDSVLTVLTVLAPVLIPLGLVLYHLILQRLPSEQAKRVEANVQLFVSAVEQVYKNVPGSGAYKKAMVQQMLAKAGVKADPARVDALIEAAVAALPLQSAVAH